MFPVEGTAQAKARRGGTAYGAHSRVFWLPGAGAEEGKLVHWILVWKFIVDKRSCVVYSYLLALGALKPGLCSSPC